MERNIQRIHGIKTELHHLSDDELEAHMGYAHGRVDAAVHDLELLGQESARRFALADAALQDTVEMPAVDPAQAQLFQFPEPLPNSS